MNDRDQSMKNHLATKVMGWSLESGQNDSDWEQWPFGNAWFSDEDWVCDLCDWNPLTDWRACGVLIEKVLSGGLSVDPTTLAISSGCWVDVFMPDRLGSSAGDSILHAICEAIAIATGWEG